jgi:hypothetical protein
MEYSPKSFHGPERSFENHEWVKRSTAKDKYDSEIIKIINKKNNENAYKSSDNSNLRIPSDYASNDIDNLPFHSSENTTNLMSETNSESIISYSIPIKEPTSSAFNFKIDSKISNTKEPDDEEKFQSVNVKKKSNKKSKKIKSRKKKNRTAFSFFDKKHRNERDSLINNIRMRVSNKKYKTRKQILSKTFVGKKNTYKIKSKASVEKAVNEQKSHKIIEIKKQLMGMIKYKPGQTNQAKLLNKFKRKDSKISEKSNNNLKDLNQKHLKKNSEDDCSLVSSMTIQLTSKEYPNQDQKRLLSKSLINKGKKKNKCVLRKFKPKKFCFRSPTRINTKFTEALSMMKSAPHEHLSDNEKSKSVKKQGKKNYLTRFMKTTKENPRKAKSPLVNFSKINDLIKKIQNNEMKETLLSAEKSSKADKKNYQKSEKTVVNTFNDYGISNRSIIRGRRKSNESHKKQKKRINSTKTISSNRSLKKQIKSSLHKTFKSKKKKILENKIKKSLNKKKK